MSKVKIQGNAAGTGIFTVAAPATNTDRTLTLPDVDATILTSAGGTVNSQLIIKQSQGAAYGGWVTALNLNGYFPGYDENSVRATIDSGIPNVGTLNTTYGWLGLATRGGDGLNRRLIVDAAGRISTPYQPSFDAYGTVGNYSVTSEVTPPLSSTNFNVGSHYNTSNGRFTAPIAGKYFFRFHTYKQTTSNLTRVRINKNGVISVYHIVPNSVQETVTLSAIINLAIGDYVYPQLQADGATDFYLADNHTNFSGYLLG